MCNIGNPYFFIMKFLASLNIIKQFPLSSFVFMAIVMERVCSAESLNNPVHSASMSIKVNLVDEFNRPVRGLAIDPMFCWWVRDRVYRSDERGTIHVLVHRDWTIPVDPLGFNKDSIADDFRLDGPGSFRSIPPVHSVFRNISIEGMNRFMIDSGFGNGRKSSTNATDSPRQFASVTTVMLRQRISGATTLNKSDGVQGWPSPSVSNQISASERIWRRQFRYDLVSDDKTAPDGKGEHADIQVTIEEKMDPALTQADEDAFLSKSLYSNIPSRDGGFVSIERRDIATHWSTWHPYWYGNTIAAMRDSASTSAGSRWYRDQLAGMARPWRTLTVTVDFLGEGNGVALLPAVPEFAHLSFRHPRVAPATGYQKSITYIQGWGFDRVEGPATAPRLVMSSATGAHLRAVPASFWHLGQVVAFRIRSPRPTTRPYAPPHWAAATDAAHRHRLIREVYDREQPEPWEVERGAMVGVIDERRRADGFPLMTHTYLNTDPASLILEP